MGKLKKKLFRDTKPTTRLDCVPFHAIKHKLKPFDLVLFTSKHHYKALNQYRTERHVDQYRPPYFRGNKTGFTHVGIIVKRHVLPEAISVALAHQTDPDELLVWESTTTGGKKDSVSNALTGERFPGIQLRRLSDLVKAYGHPRKHPSRQIAVAQLQDMYMSRALYPDNLARFFHTFVQWNNTVYNADAHPLKKAVDACIPPLKKYRRASEYIDMVTDKNWLYGTELAALTYKQLALYPNFVDPHSTLPWDLLGYDPREPDIGITERLFHDPIYLYYKKQTPVQERYQDEYQYLFLQ